MTRILLLAACLLHIPGPATAHVSVRCKPAWTSLAVTYRGLESTTKAVRLALQAIVREGNRIRDAEDAKRVGGMALDFLSNEFHLSNAAHQEFFRKFQIVLACTDGK